MTESHIGAIETALAEASDGVGAARTLLDQGSSVDLAGLESHIHTLCDGIAALPPEQRLPLKHRLVALIDDLSALTETLNAQHQRLTADLRERTARTRASAAYGLGRDGRPSGSPKK